MLLLVPASARIPEASPSPIGRWSPLWSRL